MTYATMNKSSKQCREAVHDTLHYSLHWKLHAIFSSAHATLAHAIHHDVFSCPDSEWGQRDMVVRAALEFAAQRLPAYVDQLGPRCTVSKAFQAWIATLQETCSKFRNARSHVKMEITE